MIPQYILGLLMRFGPQHGYQIKKLVEEQLADFAQIKLPTIYYHLEKLEAAGFVDAEIGQQGARPEKRVYSINRKGEAEFQALLHRELDMRYRPTFDADAVFFFAEHLSGKEIAIGLDSHMARLKQSLDRIQAHRAQTLANVPEAVVCWVEIIFDHHIAHLQAEIDWAERSIRAVCNDTASEGEV